MISYKLVNSFYLRLFVVLAFAKALTSCNSSSDKEQEIAKIPMDVELRLFHKEFAEAEVADLPDLKERYPRLLSPRTPDSLLIAKIQGRDSIQDILESAVQKANFDYDEIERDVESIMRHVKYYFPEFEPTSVVTMISEVEYNYQVIPTEEALYLAMDTYLGKDSELYLGISKYIRSQLNVEQLPADVGLAYAKLFVPQTMERSLLENMVYHGKLHYIQKLFVPDASNDLIFNYTPEKYQFTVDNETEMWRYLIGEELLYDTDSQLLSRFILPAPFSKFYLEVDQNTPGGVGRYLGYKIVDAFMKNNDVSLDALIALPADEIFKRSKYKPE